MRWGTALVDWLLDRDGFETVGDLTWLCARTHRVGIGEMMERTIHHQFRQEFEMTMLYTRFFGPTNNDFSPLHRSV